jgi:hypothetical protein
MQPKASQTLRLSTPVRIWLQAPTGAAFPGRSNFQVFIRWRTRSVAGDASHGRENLSSLIARMHGTFANVGQRYGFIVT